MYVLFAVWCELTIKGQKKRKKNVLGEKYLLIKVGTSSSQYILIGFNIRQSILMENCKKKKDLCSWQIFPSSSMSALSWQIFFATSHLLIRSSSKVITSFITIHVRQAIKGILLFDTQDEISPFSRLNGDGKGGS